MTDNHSPLFDRRGLMAAAGVSLLAAGAGLPRAAPARAAARTAFADLEERGRGRLGICAIDTAGGSILGWRMDERFAHCSSFKLSLAAMVLDGARRGFWSASERLRWNAPDLLPNSPVTREHLGDGLTMAELARATLITSDNTAANVLLRRLGGPASLTAFWRRLGDKVSQLDRLEPDLNRVPPGTLRDTTTPAAMARTVAKLVAGRGIAEGDRTTLIGWMAEVETGRNRLRAAIPAGWASGDKTGTGLARGMATYVDLAFATPPGRSPLVIAAYFAPLQASEDIDPAAEGVLASAGRICIAHMVPED